MCPGTLAIAGLVGAGASAGGTLLSGIATGNAASYQAAVAQNNAIIATQNATYATEAGQTQAANTSLAGAATSGTVKAGQAANNVDVNSGSAVNVQQSQREANVLNTETVLNNAELSAYGYRSQATGYTATAGLEQYEASVAPIAAGVGAGGNLLSNASSVGFKFGNSGGTFGSSTQPTGASYPSGSFQ